MKASIKWLGAAAALALAAVALCLAAAPVANPDGLALIGFGGLIINRQNLNAAFTGFRTVFNQAFEGAESHWHRVAMEVPSTTSQEVYPWLGAITRFREWIGDRVIQNLKTYDFTIKNKSWENTVGVDRDHIADDQLGIYKPLFWQLGLDAKQHPDELVFGLLAAGFATLCYDGQYFFDTDHPVLQADGSVASVSNFQGGAGTAWFLIDDTRAIKPIIYQVRQGYNLVKMDADTDEAVFSRKEFRYGVDARSNVGFGLWQLAYASKQVLDVANYGAARAAMLGLKGDNGRPLGLRPKLLVVPPSLEQAALEVVQAERLASGATNIYRNTAQILVCPWLD